MLNKSGKVFSALFAVSVLASGCTASDVGMLRNEASYIGETEQHDNYAYHFREIEFMSRINDHTRAPAGFKYAFANYSVVARTRLIWLHRKSIL